ncbi:hypothetical protein DESUT3_20280 [Desulfuromonas versatilis]|uniref:Uncharacterized protein n=1 Tax=Desulfuromonas versatilis TaxID=2802975 RepID=A0ABN6DZL1_9BACT|nr:hypothetical protein DESUT3_20280 [Desulfuromonas versatilis]
MLAAVGIAVKTARIDKGETLAHIQVPSTLSFVHRGSTKVNYSGGIGANPGARPGGPMESGGGDYFKWQARQRALPLLLMVSMAGRVE